jgi:hypothetical protein
MISNLNMRLGSELNLRLNFEISEKKFEISDYKFAISEK